MYVYMLWLGTCFFLVYFSAKLLPRVRLCFHPLFCCHLLLWQNAVPELFAVTHLLKPFSTFMLSDKIEGNKSRLYSLPYPKK